MQGPMMCRDKEVGLLRQRWLGPGAGSRWCLYSTGLALSACCKGRTLSINYTGQPHPNRSEVLTAIFSAPSHRLRSMPPFTLLGTIWTIWYNRPTCCDVGPDVHISFSKLYQRTLLAAIVRPID
jgi:hypothetical protein